jgi:ribosomal protein L16 Arg81 hydroxylase
VNFDLAYILAPISVETFEREYREKRPLIVRRDDPLYYRDLLTFEGIDEILSTSNLPSAHLRIIRDGQDSTLVASDSSAFGLEQVYAQYREGSTIVLQFIHERWRPLTKLCASLSAEVSAGFQVNAYLTPQNARGLGIHYDTHDVFVLQLEGSKHWRLFESPVRLPLPGQPYRTENQTPAAQLQEFDLNAGDAFYMPRGVVHEAASTNSTSLHLTVGILSSTWAEVVLASVESLIESDVRFRESLPPGFARDQAIRREAENHLTELLNLLPDEISTRSAITNAVERAWLSKKPILEGHLLDLESAPSITLNTLVRRRSAMQWKLSEDGEDLYLHFHGKKLKMFSYVKPDLRFIEETDEPFTGDSLPGELDGEGRLVLIRRLLREGFLTVSSPFRSTPDNHTGR